MKVRASREEDPWMGEGTTAKQPERQALRRQLRQAGWNVGEQTKKRGRVQVPLWPAPHTGPAEGIEPRWVEGGDKTEALRSAVRELCEPPPELESERPDPASE